MTGVFYCLTVKYLLKFNPWKYMDIQVDREIKEDGLIFTIKVTNPHQGCFKDAEKQMMQILDLCKYEVSQVTLEENKLKDDVVGLIHAAKEKMFNRILRDLKFSIENDLRPKFQPICQEIYNWLHDQQSGDLKSWMIEFDPQRTKYYFDNDVTAQKFNSMFKQASEHDDDEDD